MATAALTRYGHTLALTWGIQRHLHRGCCLLASPLQHVTTTIGEHSRVKHFSEAQRLLRGRVDTPILFPKRKAWVFYKVYSGQVRRELSSTANKITRVRATTPIVSKPIL
jgi:hypothetical protein